MLAPYEVTLGPDIYVESTYNSMRFYWAWVEYARRGLTVCGGFDYGDTGQCNYTTLQANWALINVNTYCNLTQVQKTWALSHELGHVFGLGHHSGGLMNSTYTSTWDMSHVDYHIDAWY